MGRKRFGRSNPGHSSGEHPQTGLPGFSHVLVSMFQLKMIHRIILFSGDPLYLHHRLLPNHPLAVCNDGSPARFGSEFKVSMIFFSLSVIICQRIHRLLVRQCWFTSKVVELASMQPLANNDVQLEVLRLTVAPSTRPRQRT